RCGPRSSDGPLLDPGHCASSGQNPPLRRGRIGMTERGAYWRARPVLVTGGTGLVGSHLVAALLASGADVAVLLRDHDRRSELFRSGNIGRVAVTEGQLESLAAVERGIAVSGASVVFRLGA